MSGSDARVLLAYDGSPSSATAIAAAGRLIEGRRAVVCNVWAPLSRPIFHAEPAQLPGVLADAAEELDQIELEAAQRTAAEGVRLAEAAGFRPEPLCVPQRDHTWRALLDAAGSVGASIVVAGAQGLSGIQRALLGSVSTGLVHHAPLPLLVVPGATEEPPSDGPVLLCYDRTESAEQAIGAASELVARADALVLHVWEPWVAHVPVLASVSGSVTGMAKELDEIASEQSANMTTDGVEAARLAGFEATGLSESATGPVWRTILDVGDQHRSAVIVLGSRRPGGPLAALGSVSNGVVHHSQRPVFITPPPPKAEPSEE